MTDANPLDAWPSLHEAVEEYRTELGWAHQGCSCGATYYYKRDNGENCHAYSCLGGYRFLDADPPTSFRTAHDVWSEAERRLNERGYPTEAPTAIENEAGTTFLTVAGIQVFDEVIFDEAPAGPGPIVVAQPSIRTGAKEAVGEREGITTSFVNLATVRTAGGVEAFIGDVDTWLDLLSELGLFVSDCSLVVDAPTREDWGTGEFDKYAVRLVYGGLELGEFGILRGVPQETRDDLVIVDCGFSLERIVWALNRTPSFSAIVGPVRAGIHESIEYLDTVRTLTLLAAGGVTPGPDGAGYRFRRFVDDLLHENPTGDCMELVRFYHAYWRTFTSLSKFAPTRTRIRREVDRQYNQRFADLANKPDADVETDEFVRTLLDSGNSWDAVHRAATKE